MMYSAAIFLGLGLVTFGLIATSMWAVAIGTTLIITATIYDVTRHDDEPV